MNAVTSPAIAAMIIPIGFAAMIKFNAACATPTDFIIGISVDNAPIIPCIIVTALNATSAAPMPVIVAIILSPFSMIHGIASAFSHSTNDFIVGSSSSMIGCNKSTLIIRLISSNALPRSLYLIASISCNVSFVASAEPLTSVNAFTPSMPKSSHIVPNRSTPA